MATENTAVRLTSQSQPGSEFATFAAGCFWSVELHFQRIPGVLQTQVGYTGGDFKNPSYREVCSGITNHAEAVRLEYNPNIVSYPTLLQEFWKKHDPTQLNRQGNDIGTQYRSAIFCHSDEQLKLAKASKEQVQTKYSGNIYTTIEMAGPFYPAEEYHQRYLEKGGQCSAKGCTDAIRCYG
ncbi:hypothetical protein EV182_002777 [Spiromyces aspiralis]|uniref:Uncharacterized protein n=1 Tax=Spiromyces aspiralis TaxID=68401 RepID=A0ACC1HDN5_9FUNG|nr:hypothetical protein EV182_002777 [Spiromyces aspiralis]